MESPDPSDLELVEACSDGDLAAFETLYRRHRDRVVSLAFRFCGNRDDSLDVLQETFAYFLKKLPGFELTCRFTTFLYPVVKHLALDKAKATRRLAPLPEGAEPSVGYELPEDMEAMLQGLSGIHREVILLRFADGMDLKEIALALDIPLGTVKSRLHLALAKLRERLR